MHVLMIAPFRSPLGKPHLGAFFRDHAIAVQRQHWRVGQLGVELRSLLTFSKGSLSEFDFSIERLDDGGIDTWRRRGWRIPFATRVNARLWQNLAVGLAEAYMERFGRPDIVLSLIHI